jgi:hypothetical protein
MSNTFPSRGWWDAGAGLAGWIWDSVVECMFVLAQAVERSVKRKKEGIVDRRMEVAPPRGMERN